MRVAWAFIAAVAFLVFTSGGPHAADAPAKDEKPRNPFGVPDVKGPDGSEVQEFAANVKLSGDALDPNAEQWVKDATTGKKRSIEGEWSDRWNRRGGPWFAGKGLTQIKDVGDRVYVLVNASTGKYLIDLERTKDRLVGSYQGIDSPDITGPCVFLVVDDERLDGNWQGFDRNEAGRWDFRRKLK